jgi:hypothetical protein
MPQKQLPLGCERNGNYCWSAAVRFLPDRDARRALVVEAFIRIEVGIVQNDSTVAAPPI